MKKITFNNQEFNYEVMSGGWTQFYSTEENLVPRYKMMNSLFGNKTINKPKKLFEVWINIENPNRTKQEVEQAIKDALEKYEIFEKRKSEIEKGEII